MKTAKAASLTELMTEASDLLVKMRNDLPRTIAAADLGTPSKLPFKLLSMRELLIHRIADLGSGALELYENSRPVCGIVLTRAVMETTAALFALSRIQESVAATRDISSLDDRLMQLLFGSRAEMTPVSAVNVLTQLDKMDGTFAGVREWYDQLSEFAHPNWAGVMGAYGELDRARVILTLGLSRKACESAPGIGLQALCACLEVAAHVYNGMATSFRSFCAICHGEQDGQRGSAPGQSTRRTDSRDDGA